MQLAIEKHALFELLGRQLSNLFVYDGSTDGQALNTAIDKALLRCEHCFNATRHRSKYYTRHDELYFNPFHSGQYTIFLYFLSNTLFREQADDSGLADRVYYLNKVMNGVDLFYEVALPDAFFLDHPVGTVMGRAEYGEMFSFSQNCTVGNNHGHYPRLGRNVRLYSGAKILGDCTVGDNVVMAANAYIIDQDVPDCSIVFGSSPNITIKRKDAAYFNA